VYLLPGKTFFTTESEAACSSFFAPWDRSEEPYIRIATGDYPELRRERGRDNALAAILLSLALQVIHYQQWVKTGDLHKRGVNRKALIVLDRYAETRDHP